MFVCVSVLCVCGLFAQNLGQGEVHLGCGGELQAQLPGVAHGVLDRLGDVLVEEGRVDEVVDLQLADEGEVRVVDVLRVCHQRQHLGGGARAQLGVLRDVAVAEPQHGQRHDGEGVGVALLGQHVRHGRGGGAHGDLQGVAGQLGAQHHGHVVVVARAQQHVARQRGGRRAPAGGGDAAAQLALLAALGARLVSAVHLAVVAAQHAPAQVPADEAVHDLGGEVHDDGGDHHQLVDHRALGGAPALGAGREQHAEAGPPEVEREHHAVQERLRLGRQRGERLFEDAPGLDEDGEAHHPAEHEEHEAGAVLGERAGGAQDHHEVQLEDEGGGALQVLHVLPRQVVQLHQQHGARHHPGRVAQPRGFLWDAFDVEA
mmetsp:Transcript_28700/g.70749  ORF Transcript_28700/g.70749 Transcript_28700/m.70749 type:complete len:373 (+) Transcript_28700:383-1501(+)